MNDTKHLLAYSIKNRSKCRFRSRFLPLMVLLWMPLELLLKSEARLLGGIAAVVDAAPLNVVLYLGQLYWEF